MTTDIKELAQWLRDDAERHNPHLYRDSFQWASADALEALAGEVERLTLNGIHSCWEECPRLPCVQGREIRTLIAERDRLKAALVKIEQGDYERSGRNFYNTTTRTPSKHDTCGHGKAYWDACENCCSSFARKALEGAAGGGR